MTLFEKNVIPLLYKSYLRVLLLQTAEIRTIPKSLPRSFQNNFKCLFFKRLYQIDEILKYNILDITKLFRCDIQCQPCGTRNFGLRYNNVTSRIISSMKEFWRQTVNINDISKCDK